MKKDKEFKNFLKVVIGIYFIGMIIYFLTASVLAMAIFLFGAFCVTFLNKIVNQLIPQNSARTKPKSKRLLKRRNT